MPAGMPIQQTSEHCAATAYAHAAPVFCVTVPSGKCALYFPETISEVRGPLRDDNQCFAQMLGCRTCSATIRIVPSDTEGTRFDLREDGVVNSQIHRLDNTSWKWMSAVTHEDSCSAKCLDGFLLYRWIIFPALTSYQYRCFHDGILHAWITICVLMWVYGVGVTVFLVWKLCFRRNTRCTCGVGWLYWCSKQEIYQLMSGHETSSNISGLRTEEVLNCPDCKFDAGLLCENPDLQQSALDWRMCILCLQLPLVVIPVVLGQWDSLFMGGEFAYFYKADASSSMMWGGGFWTTIFLCYLFYNHQSIDCICVCTNLRVQSSVSMWTLYYA